MTQFMVRLFFKNELIFIIIIAFGMSFLLNLVLGQSMAWDMRNYHISSVYELINNKHFHDFATSQRQGWFNPLPYFPAYFVTSFCNSVAGSAIFCLLSTPTLVLVYYLPRKFYYHSNNIISVFCAAFCLILALSSTIFLSVLGTTMVEAWLGVLIIGSIYLAVGALRSEDANRREKYFILSGALLGVAFGLKSTNVVYLAASGVALLALFALRVVRLRILIVFGVAATLAFLVIGGWWWLKIYWETGNPVFPNMNNIFRSPLTDPVALLDEEFQPKSWVEFFSNPVALAMGDHHRKLSTIMPVRDARSLIGLAASILLFSRVGFLLINKRGAEIDPSIVLLGVFYVAADLFWFRLFNIDRYALPLDMLAFVLLAVALKSVPLPVAVRPELIVIAIGVAVLVGTKPVRSARAAFSDSWLGARIPSSLNQSNTLYVMTGWDALGWTVAYLPRSADFVRVAGNLAIEPSRGIGLKVRERIAAHHGPIRSLTTNINVGSASGELARFGLSIRPRSCVRIINKSDPVWSCALRRLEDRE